MHFVASTFPSSKFWGIDQSIRYGTTPILSDAPSIIDIVTAFLLIADDAFTRYQKATGSEEDETTGLLRLGNSQFSSLQSLFFQFEGVRVPI